MPVKVDGSSMYPTLHDGDLAFMSRLDLNSKQIKRFDIVTIDCKQLDNVIIKRVIGLPGEKLFTKMIVCMLMESILKKIILINHI